MSSQAGSSERPPDAGRRNLRRLLKPASVAFFGGKAVLSGVEYLRALGFKGDVWIVNPAGGQIGGVPCFRSVADLPAIPDASVIATPPLAAIQIAEDLAKAGAPGAVCYAAGFAEVGPQGQELQMRLIAAAGEMALVGPNCTGLVNFFDGIGVTVVNHGFSRPDRGLAIVAQSGTIAHNAAMSDRSLPIGYVVSVGNQACLDCADFIEAFLDDPRVNAIGVYVEEIADPRAFSMAALRALEANIPIVAFKGGVSESGKQAALSHTASLSGADSAYDAFFAKYGIVRASTFEHFLESLKLLSVSGVPRGEKLAILTCSGMEAMLCADLAEVHGISTPAPSPRQAGALRDLLPKLAAVANPLDYTMGIWGKEKAQRDVFVEIMGATYDGAALITNYPSADYGDPADWDAATDAFIAAQRATGLPGYFISSLPEGAPAHVRQRLLQAGIVPLQGLDDGMAAIGLGIRYRNLREHIRSDRLPEPMELAKTPLARIRTLDEWTGKQRLASAGVSIPRGILTEPAQAVVAAERIGFPVVVKAVGEDIAHKSELGLVALNLRDVQDVRVAVERIGRCADGAGTMLLVEAMIGDAVAEIIVGMKRDPLFGMTLLLGSGGIFAELVRDTELLLPPVGRQDVMSALARLRCYPLISGFRGRPRGDLDGLVTTILAIAEIPSPEALVELDVNPVLVRPEGLGAIAVDALFVIAA